MSSKLKIVYISSAIVLLVLIVLIFSAITKKTTTPEVIIPNPTPKLQPTTTQNAKHFSTPLRGNAVDTFVTEMTSPKQLTTPDADIRRAFITQADTTTNIIHQTPNYLFLYAPGADLFQVEILSTNVPGAEQDAVSWLLGQGLSQPGVCNLPVIFFRDPKQFNNNQTTGLEIYPQPDFCQK